MGGNGTDIGIGIDFGTSNSSVAVYDGESLSHLALEPASPSPAVMPTALYLDSRRQATIGRRAVDRYLRENAGRLIELEREDLGEIEYTVADTDDTKGGRDGAITEVARVHAYVDRALPGRLFRGLKRWLSREDLERVRVFDRPYRIVALLTPILVHLRRALREAGHDRLRVYVGRPVVFEGPRGGESTALARLTEACRHAELGDVTLFQEPVAAALSFVHERRLAPGEVVLCFDFGGGTLDLCALRATEGGFETLPTHGIPLGGDAIDQLVFRSKLFPALGEGAMMPSAVVDGPRDVPFPFRQFGERLLNWQLAYELNRPDLRELLGRGCRARGEDGVRVQRLREVVSRNLAYPLLQAVERAKLELSERDRATIRVAELDLEVPITRDEFEELLAKPLRSIDAAIDDTLAGAGLGAEQVSLVASTGGSSRIPAVRALLERRFPGRVLEHAPFTGIAAGLAIAARDRA